MEKESLSEAVQRGHPSGDPSYDTQHEPHALSEVDAVEDTAFLTSLTAGMPRGSDHMGGYMPPDRRPQRNSRIALPPQHAYLDEGNSGIGLERLASLRMDSGDLTDSRMVPEMHPAQRMMEPYGMRSHWAEPPHPGPQEGRAPRPLRYEDEVGPSGMYGPSLGRHTRPDRMRGGGHLAGTMSDPYLAHGMEQYMPTPKSASRSRHHPSHYSATDYSTFDAQMNEPYRDGRRWQSTSSMSGLQRSASEGWRLRDPGLPRHRHRPHSAHVAHQQVIPETSANSGKLPGSKESSGPGAPNESPDFAMIYAFLGSMFDPVCHMINHADVMQQMAAIDRETTILILENCVHNLDTPYFLDCYLDQIRAVSRGGPMRAPPPSRDLSDFDIPTSHNHA